MDAKANDKSQSSPLQDVMQVIARTGLGFVDDQFSRADEDVARFRETALQRRVHFIDQEVADKARGEGFQVFRRRGKYRTIYTIPNTVQNVM